MRFGYGKVYRPRSLTSCRPSNPVARMQHLGASHLGANAARPAHLLTPPMPHLLNYRTPTRRRITKVDYRRMPVFDGFAQATADCLIDLEEGADYSSSPDIMAYLAILGRRNKDLSAPPTDAEVENGRAYLASEYRRGVGHFIDPATLPTSTEALPLAGLSIFPAFAQSARPGMDPHVAVWARFLRFSNLATKVSRAHHESLEGTSDLHRKTSEYPLRQDMITTNIRAPLPYGVPYPEPGSFVGNYLKLMIKVYRLNVHPVSFAYLRPWLSYYTTDAKNCLRAEFSSCSPDTWKYWTNDLDGYPLDMSPTPIVHGWTQENGLEGVEGWVKYVAVD